MLRAMKIIIVTTFVATIACQKIQYELVVDIAWLNDLISL